jgi:4-hydroxybenzoate polyprenyltransferase
MKRITYWPQAFLGLTFNWGALLGWTAMTNTLDFAVTLPLYASGVFWTLLYDTIYALQDRHDDKLAGIKSTALAIEGRTKLFLSLFAAGTSGMLALAGYVNGHGLPFFVVSIGGTILHALWQLTTLKETNARDAGKKFASNVWIGVIISAGILLDLARKRLASTHFTDIEEPANNPDRVEEESIV